MNGRYQDVYRAPAGAKHAVLLLHGILSAPQYFDFLLPEIPANWAVSGILLEGHGGRPVALGRTRMAVWQKQAEKALCDLMQHYPHIVIAAHSMGTLFAVRLALKYPDRISGMLLLGVPVYAHLTAFGACGALLCAAGYRPVKAPRLCAMRNAFSISPDWNPLHYLGWIPRYRELFAEIAHMRGCYRRLTVPSAAYQSARDEFVSLRSLETLQQSQAIRLHVLRHASHFYYPADEQARILCTWRRMLRMVSGKRCQATD